MCVFGVSLEMSWLEPEECECVTLLELILSENDAGSQKKHQPGLGVQRRGEES